MNLYLVQHAEATSEQENPLRPLTEKGLQDIKKAAAFISRQTDTRIQTIFTSRKTRAQQTGRVLAEAVNPPGGVQDTDGLSPLDDPAIWAGRLSEITENMMLVGHLPHLSLLASLLLCGMPEQNLIDFKMVGIVCLRRDEKGGWSLAWMVVPEIV